MRSQYTGHYKLRFGKFGRKKLGKWDAAAAPNCDSPVAVIEMVSDLFLLTLS
jgi:hypothetical protein